MNLSKVYEIAKVVTVLDCWLAIAVPSMGIKVAVELAMGNPQKGIERAETPQKVREEKPKVALERFRVCYEAPLVEIKEPEKVEEPAREEKQPEPVEVMNEMEVPFEWVGVSIEEEGMRNLAIIEDKSSQRQLIVREGKFIPGSRYKVVEIREDEIQLELEGNKGSIKRPGEWQLINLGGKDISSLEANVAIGSELIVSEDEVMAKYGLREGDRIMEVEGKCVSNLAELKQAMGSGKKGLWQITVWRNEEAIIFMLPEEILKRLVGGAGEK